MAAPTTDELAERLFRALLGFVTGGWAGEEGMEFVTGGWAGEEGMEFLDVIAT